MSRARNDRNEIIVEQKDKYMKSYREISDYLASNGWGRIAKENVRKIYLREKGKYEQN